MSIWPDNRPSDNPAHAAFIKPPQWAHTSPSADGLIRPILHGLRDPVFIPHAWARPHILPSIAFWLGLQRYAPGLVTPRIKLWDKVKQELVEVYLPYLYQTDRCGRCVKGGRDLGAYDCLIVGWTAGDDETNDYPRMGPNGKPESILSYSCLNCRVAGKACDRLGSKLESGQYVQRGKGLRDAKALVDVPLTDFYDLPARFEVYSNQHMGAGAAATMIHAPAPRGHTGYGGRNSLEPRLDQSRRASNSSRHYPAELARAPEPDSEPKTPGVDPGSHALSDEAGARSSVASGGIASTPKAARCSVPVPKAAGGDSLKRPAPKNSLVSKDIAAKRPALDKGGARPTAPSSSSTEIGESIVATVDSAFPTVEQTDAYDLSTDPVHTRAPLLSSVVEVPTTIVATQSPVVRPPSVCGSATGPSTARGTSAQLPAVRPPSASVSEPDLSMARSSNAQPLSVKPRAEGYSAVGPSTVRGPAAQLPSVQRPPANPSAAAATTTQGPTAQLPIVRPAFVAYVPAGATTTPDPAAQAVIARPPAHVAAAGPAPAPRPAGRPPAALPSIAATTITTSTVPVTISSTADPSLNGTSPPASSTSGQPQQSHKDSVLPASGATITAVSSGRTQPGPAVARLPQANVRPPASATSGRPIVTTPSRSGTGTPAPIPAGRVGVRVRREPIQRKLDETQQKLSTTEKALGDVGAKVFQYQGVIEHLKAEKSVIEAKRDEAIRERYEMDGERKRLQERLCKAEDELERAHARNADLERDLRSARLKGTDAVAATNHQSATSLSLGDVQDEAVREDKELHSLENRIEILRSSSRRRRQAREGVVDLNIEDIAHVGRQSNGVTTSALTPPFTPRADSRAGGPSGS